MNKKHLFLASFVITIATITYGEIKYCHDIPWPPRIIATALAFGLLDLFSVVSEELASVISIGFVLAAVANTLSGNKNPNSNYFSTSCNHSGATIQPASYQSLQGSPEILA